MKINEVEALVHITKKNIRFYEEQGLLSPKRNSENGYRDYSEADVKILQQIKLLRKLGVPIEEIREMEQWKDSKINDAKVRLAYEVTKIIHGEEEAEKAKSVAESLFGGSGISENMATTNVGDSLVDDEIGLLDMMLLAKLIPSKGEGRRLVQQGGVFIDDVKVDAFDKKITKAELEKGIVLRKGKKTFHRFVL